MIREIGVELQARLRVRKCPIDVIMGPEDTTTGTFGRERIVIERDRKAKDSFTPALSQAHNKDIRRIRNIATKITIYAQSHSSGAQAFEHERRAEQILDMVFVGLEEVITARKNGWSVKGGGFITPPDLEKSENIGGAVYEFLFTVERAVMVQTWIGEARPTKTLESGVLRSTTHVIGNDPEMPEVGCGA